jgi:hypothetical protein
MDRLILPFTPRFITLTLAAVVTVTIIVIMASTGASGIFWWLCLAVFGGLSALGLHDLLQERHAILRNYPIAAHLRFFFEEIESGRNLGVMRSASDVHRSNVRPRPRPLLGVRAARRAETSASGDVCSSAG